MDLMDKKDFSMNGIIRFAGVFESLAEACKWGEMVSKSEFCPVNFKNKAPECVLAAQYGHEIGLKPLQALQGVQIINGKPSVYGDTMLALCMGSPNWEGMHEHFLTAEQLYTLHGIKVNFQGQAAVCEVKRKGEKLFVTYFSEDDALNAGLLNRSGPWKTYKRRMLQMRARGFGLRDKFADVLKGIISSEEAEDYLAASYEVVPEMTDSLEPINEPQVSIDKETGEILETKEEQPLLPTKEMIDEIASIIATLEVPNEQVLKWLSKMSVTYINDLSMENAGKLINFLKSKLKMKEKGNV